MRQRLAAIMLVLGVVLIGQTVGAAADEHESPFPEHPHVMLIGAEVDFSGEEPQLLGVRKCVDLAGGNALRLHAHHDHIHFGTAGGALRTNTTNVVAPTAPFPGVPWTDCASLLAITGLG